MPASPDTWLGALATVKAAFESFKSGVDFLATVKKYRQDRDTITESRRAEAQYFRAIPRRRSPPLRSDWKNARNDSLLRETEKNGLRVIAASSKTLRMAIAVSFLSSTIGRISLGRCVAAVSFHVYR